MSVIAEIKQEPGEALINDEVSLTSDKAFNEWSVLKGDRGTDFTEPNVNGRIIKFTPLKYSGSQFQFVLSTGNTQEHTLKMEAPKLEVVYKALAKNEQGILPNSQLTELAKITYNLSGFKNQDNASGNVVELDHIDLNISPISVIQDVYLFGLPHKATHKGDEKFILDNNNNFNPKDLVLVDQITSPSSANITLNATNGKNLVSENDGKGDYKSYFVAIATNSTLFHRQEIRIRFIKPGDTGGTNFQDFQGTDKKLKATVKWDDKLTNFKMKNIMRILNLVNVDASSESRSQTQGHPQVSTGTFLHANSWPRNAGASRGWSTDTENWVENRFTPDWPENSASISGRSGRFASGFPLIGASSQTPVFAIVALGGTPDNPARLNNVALESFTKDWFDENGVNGMISLLTGTGKSPDNYDGVNIYKDNGDGIFDPTKDNLLNGSSSAVLTRMPTEQTFNFQIPNFLFTAKQQVFGFNGFFSQYNDIYQAVNPSVLNFITNADYQNSAQQYNINNGLHYYAAGYSYTMGNNNDNSIDPFDEKKSTFFVTLRTMTHTDDGDSFAGSDNKLSPLGSSFHMYVNQLRILPSNPLNGNVAQASGIRTTDLSWYSQGVTHTNDDQRVATLYNLAMVGPVGGNDVFPFHSHYGFNKYPTREFLHNFTPEPLFGVDLCGTTDTKAKQPLGYLYKFSGLRVAINNNFASSRLANLTRDMLSGLSLWKDRLGEGSKGYWDECVDLIIDEDGIESAGGGLRDYSLLGSYEEVDGRLSSFRANDYVYFEDADNSGHYSLGESIFLDSNKTSRFENEGDEIIYNAQKTRLSDSTYLGFEGGQAMEAFRAPTLRYRDMDDNRKYSEGDVIVWDHNTDGSFNEPTELWVRPARFNWENRTISSINKDEVTGAITVDIGVDLWGDKNWAGVTVEFNDGSLSLISSNDASSFTATPFNNADTIDGKDEFWILQTDLVADTPQEVYDHNFYGSLQGTNDPRYKNTYQGYDYFLTARPQYESMKTSTGFGNLVDLTVKKDGLLVTNIGSFIRTDPVRAYAVISPPAVIKEDTNLPQKLGVFNEQSDPISVLSIDLSSGNIWAGGNVDREFEDTLQAVNVEFYNRNQFNLAGDLADLNPLDNSDLGVYSGVSLWEDDNSLSGNLDISISSSDVELVSQDSIWGDKRFDPNGQKVFYLTVNSEIIGYTDVAFLGGSYHFLGLLRGTGFSKPQNHSAGSLIVAGRNGQFEDNVDRNVNLLSSPYSSGGAGHPDLLKLDINNSLKTCTIPTNNNGDNAGPDYFVCLRTTSIITDQDSFAVAMVQWNDNMTGPDSNVFKNHTANTFGTALFTSASAQLNMNLNYGHGKTNDLLVDSEAPSSIDGFSGQRGNGAIQLSWSASLDADHAGSMLVRKRAGSSVSPDDAVSYLQDSFIETKAVYDGASTDGSGQVVSLAGLTAVFGDDDDIVVGDYVIIRSGSNRGRYEILSINDSNGLVLNETLFMDEAMSLEIGNGLVLLANEDTDLTDTKLVNGVSYEYDVYSFDDVFNYGNPSSLTLIPTDGEDDPLLPATDGVVISQNESLIVSWTNPMNSLSGTQAMVAISEGANNITLNQGQDYKNNEIITEGVTIIYINDVYPGTISTIEIDNVSNAQRYQIAVFIRDSDRNYSTPLMIYGTPSDDNVAPADVVGLKQKYDDGLTTLSWTPPNSSDLEGYVLLASYTMEALNHTNLLTSGREYEEGYVFNQGDGPVVVVAKIRNASRESVDVDFVKHLKYKVISYDERPNYSLGVYPEIDPPELLLTEENQSLSDEEDLEVPAPGFALVKDIALWNMTVTKDSLELGTVTATLADSVIGSWSDNLSSLKLLSFNDIEEAFVELGETGVVADSATFSFSNPTEYISGSNVYTFKLQATISDQVSSGDRILLESIAVNGVGVNSARASSANIDFIHSPTIALGVGSVSIHPLTIEENESGMIYAQSIEKVLKFTVEAGDFDDVYLSALKLNVSNSGEAGALNHLSVLIDGEVDERFQIESTNNGVITLLMEPKIFLAKSDSLEFCIQGLTEGNVGDLVEFTVEELLFDSTGKQNLISTGSAWNSSTLIADGLTFTNMSAINQIKRPGDDGAVMMSRLEVIAGGSADMQLKQLQWTGEINEYFDSDADMPTGANVFLAIDTNGNGVYDEVDGVVPGSMQIDVEDLALEIIFDASLGTQETGFAGTGGIFTSTSNTYFLMMDFVSLVEDGASMTVQLNNASGQVISLVGENFVQHGPVEVYGLENAEASKLNFQYGDLLIIQNPSTIADLNYSSSTNIELFNIDIFALGESMTLESMSFECLTYSDLLRYATLELQCSQGNIFVNGSDNLADFVISDFSSLDGGSWIIANGSSENFRVLAHFNLDSEIDLSSEEYTWRFTELVATGQPSGALRNINDQLGFASEPISMSVTQFDNVTLISAPDQVILKGTPNVELMTFAATVSSAQGLDEFILDNFVVGVDGGDLSDYLSKIDVEVAIVGLESFTKSYTVSNSELVVDYSNSGNSGLTLAAASTVSFRLRGDLIDLESGDSFIPVLKSFSGRSNLSFASFQLAEEQVGSLVTISAGSGDAMQTKTDYIVRPYRSSSVLSMTLNTNLDEFDASINAQAYLDSISLSFFDDSGNPMDISKSVNSLEIQLVKGSIVESLFLSSPVPSGTTSLDEEFQSASLGSSFPVLQIIYQMKEDAVNFSGEIHVNELTGSIGSDVLDLSHDFLFDMQQSTSSQRSSSWSLNDESGFAPAYISWDLVQGQQEMDFTLEG
ncbi:MAG: hypothetical protein HQL32_07190, partial [Planctomycetes bacterium]|nr:hypothetical protein [Planctomycetota bacterium]